MPPFLLYSVNEDLITIVFGDLLTSGISNVSFGIACVCSCCNVCTTVAHKFSSSKFQYLPHGVRFLLHTTVCVHFIKPGLQPKKNASGTLQIMTVFWSWHLAPWLFIFVLSSMWIWQVRDLWIVSAACYGVRVQTVIKCLWLGLISV